MLICLDFQAALEEGHQEESSSASRQAITLVLQLSVHVATGSLNMSVLISDSG